MFPSDFFVKKPSYTKESLQLSVSLVQSPRKLKLMPKLHSSVSSQFPTPRPLKPSSQDQKPRQRPITSASRAIVPTIKIIVFLIVNFFKKSVFFFRQLQKHTWFDLFEYVDGEFISYYSASTKWLCLKKKKSLWSESGNFYVTKYSRFWEKPNRQRCFCSWRIRRNSREWSFFNRLLTA